ncbi:MAG: hypothetical protein D3914_08170 [Candidatus Electrothrix sp. LOE2]|nr:hypothetical protein [Candidatus Electrothrix sp. LOE2]
MIINRISGHLSINKFFVFLFARGIRPDQERGSVFFLPCLQRKGQAVMPGRHAGLPGNPVSILHQVAAIMPQC